MKPSLDIANLKEFMTSRLPVRNLAEAPHAEGKTIPDENEDLASTFLNLIVTDVLDQIIF